ncbi:MAG: hypothetical protein K2K76_03160, partial [Muribaculaceae bacterium]|nr:hypothetical protein [Muribaculaceae bacterium]
MRKDYIIRFFAAALMLITAFAGRAAANDADSVRVLWIGNSYTFFNDLPAMVQNIAKTNGVKMAY